MRRKVISCVICALMITTILVVEISKEVSAQVTEEWVVRYNVANDGDYGNAIAIGPSGNIYVTGHSYIGYNSDYATVAYDPYGNELWVARYNGPAGPCYDPYGDYPYDIVVDSSENIYVTGKSRSTGCPYDNEEGHDIATVAYDSNGTQLWVTKYNGPEDGRDIARAMAISPNGNIIVTGESRGIGTDLDYVTIAYDSNGTQLWASRYNGLGNGLDEAKAVVIDDKSANIYVTGRSTDGNGYFDYATVAYDLNGTELWVIRYNGPGFSGGIANALAIDSFGNIYVTGQSWGSHSTTIGYNSVGNELWVARDNGSGNISDYAMAIATDDLSGNIYITGAGKEIGNDYDYYTIAYDSSGNKLWYARYDGPDNDYDIALAIDIDPDGNVYVTGRSDGGHPSNGGTYIDYATVAYDSDGNQLWVARYNGPGNDYDQGLDITIDQSGNIFVTGRSRGNETGPDMTTIKYSRSRIQSIIDIDPNTLNLKSKGRWITCYIDLPGYDVNDIDISTILLEDTIPAEWGDIQNTTLMVKFDRSEVEDMLSPGIYNLKVTGELTGGTKFEGYSDEIRVIDPP